MSERKAYQLISLLGLLAGLVLFVYLIQETGVGAIFGAIRLMGASFLLLLLLAGARQYVRAIAWYHSIEPAEREIGLWELFRIRLVGEAVTDLTIAGPFLGETTKALIVSRRLPVAHTLSSLFIENLLYSVSVALFILVGLFLFLANFTMAAEMRLAMWVTGVGVVAVVLGSYLLIRQRWLPLGRLLDWNQSRGVRWPWLERREDKIRAFEENIYSFFGRRRGLFFYIFFLELLTNFTGVIEAYLILRVTMQESSLLAAFIIESVNRIVNTVFAFVPLRVGVEEGGAAVTFRALGYRLAEGVSFSIIRKIRMLLWVAVGLAILAGETARQKREPRAASAGGKRKRLIVNADDFGLTEGVNRAICEAHARGIVTSASLLATGTAFCSAVEMARALPQLGVGVHLNLTGGKPVADPASIRSLVNARGQLAYRPTSLVLKLTMGQVHLEDIERELRAQIEKVRAAGIRPTHLDGHKHIHAFPAIGRTVLRLAHECGIAAVRAPDETSVALTPLLWRNPGASSKIVSQRLVALVLGWFAGSYRREARGAQIAVPERFYGISETGFLDRERLREILLALGDGTSELMCHPGYADAALIGVGTRLVAERQREFDAVSAAEIKSLAAELGIELVSFRDLAEAS